MEPYINGENAGLLERFGQHSRDHGDHGLHAGTRWPAGSGDHGREFRDDRWREPNHYDGRVQLHGIKRLRQYRYRHFYRRDYRLHHSADLYGLELGIMRERIAGQRPLQCRER